MSSAIRTGAMALLALWWVTPGVARADVCDELHAKVCATAFDIGDCVRALDARLRDRDGARLTGEPRAKVCRKLLDDHRKLTTMRPRPGRLERVLIGRWRVDVEGSMTLSPQLQALSPDDRKQAIETFTDKLGGVSLEFAADGLAISRRLSEETRLTYRVVEQSDDVITVELTEADRTSRMTFTLKGNALQLRLGKTTMLLRRE